MIIALLACGALAKTNIKVGYMVPMSGSSYYLADYTQYLVDLVNEDEDLAVTIELVSWDTLSDDSFDIFQNSLKPCVKRIF